MKRFQMIVLILVIVLTADAGFAQDFHLDSPRNKGMFRFEINNDAMWDRDSNFSNGWSLQYHTKRYANWDQTKAPALFKWVGNHIPSIGNREGIVRYGQGLGQNMITPGDLSNPDPPDGDLPYAGTLTYTLNWQNFNRQSSSTFQINLGVLGEESYAEEVQKFVHDNLLGMEEPKGWDTQRDSEPILNLAYSKIWRLANWGKYHDGWAGQIGLSPSIHLGNLLTAVEMGLALRFGWNIQEGFSAYPAPPGRGIFQSSHLPKPSTASPHALEFIMGVRATALAYSVVYDGSIITDDDRSVDRNLFIHSGGFGLNYHYYDLFSIRFTLLFNSDILDTDSLPESLRGENETSADNSYGTLVMDFHF